MSIDMNKLLKIFQSRKNITSHPKFNEVGGDVLFGIFVSSYYLATLKKPNVNPFNDHDSIAYITHNEAYITGSGDVVLPTINDYKWLDTVHLRKTLCLITGSELAIHRPNADSVMFVGEDAHIKELRDMFNLYYSAGNEDPYYLCVQLSSNVQPFAFAVLTFKYPEE